MTQVPNYLTDYFGPTPTPRMIREAQPEKEETETPSFMDVFFDSTVTGPIIDFFHRPNYIDTDFKITAEYLERRVNDLPAELVKQLANSNSEEEFLYRERSIRDRLKTKQAISDMGMTGLAYQLGVSMLDPAFLIAAPFASLAAGTRAVGAGVTATKTLRAQAAMRGFGISAAVDVPIEGMRWVIDPLTDEEDFVINTLASVALGTGISAAFPTFAGFQSSWKKQVELERLRITSEIEKSNLDSLIESLSPENSTKLMNAAQRRGIETEGKELSQIVREMHAQETRKEGPVGPFLSEEGTERYVNGLTKKEVIAEAKARNIKTTKKTASELRKEIIESRRKDFELDNQSITAILSSIEDSGEDLKNSLRLLNFTAEDYAKELIKPMPPESIFSRMVNWVPHAKPIAIMARRSENERLRDFFSLIVEDPTGSPRIDAETAVYLNRKTAMGDYHRARTAIKRSLGVQTLKDFDGKIAEAIRTGTKLKGLEGSAQEAVEKFFSGLAEYAEEAGIAGFKKFNNARYIPREALASSVAKAVEDYGQDTVFELVTKALKNNNPDMDEKRVKATVKGWMKYAENPDSYVNARVSPRGNSRDKISAMEQALNVKGLSKEDRNEILDLFVPKSNDPHLGMTNRRINFDESAEIVVEGKKNLKFSDLLQNDLTLLMEKHAARILGSAELTKISKALEIPIAGSGSVPTRDDMLRWMNKGGNIDEGMEEGFNVVYNAMMGLHQGNLGEKSRRALRFLQDLAFIQSMGNVGVAQLPEIANSTVSNGLLATLQSVPRLRKLIRQAQNGELKDSVLAELDAFVSAGDMLEEGFTRTYKVHDNVGLDEKGISINDNPVMSGLKTLTSGAPVTIAGRGITINPIGIGPMDELLRNGHVLATLQNWTNLAYKVQDGKRITNNFWSKSRKRFEYLGLDSDEIDGIMKELTRQDVAVVEQGLLGKNIVKLNLNAMDDKLRNKLLFALRRDADRVIQRNKVGNFSPWFNHPMGNLLLQFRKFAINATNKQLVYNLQMADAKALASFLGTVALGTVSYIVTTEIASAKYSGRELREFKKDAYGSKEFLGAEVPKLMIAGVIRSGMSGIVPAFAGPVSQWIDPQEEDLFNTYRTTGYGLSIFDPKNTPAGSIAYGSFEFLQEGIPALLNAVSGGRLGNELTEPELKRMLRQAPLRNTVIMNIIFKQLIEAADLPERQR